MSKVHKVGAVMAAIFVVACGNAFADEGSATDAFTGATVTSVSPARGGDDTGDIFRLTGDSIETGNSTYVFGDDFAAGSVDSIEFSTSSAVTLTGINLIVQGDGNAESGGGSRAASSFTFRANVDTSNPDFEVLLVNGQDPVSDRSTNSYTFSAITASAFRAEFVQSGNGVRVVELDAVVPEPASLSILGISAFGLLARRRRS